MDRPNILYLHSHDTGRYIQPYGYAVPTPDLQVLAAEGVLFRQAFCAAPTCSASRAALLTGQSPHAAGMIGLAHRGFALNDYGQHIIHTLRAAGYRSALAGIQHVARDSAVIGYDEVLSPRHGSEEALAAAKEFLARRHEQPFFLSVGFSDTHRSWRDESAAADARYCRPPDPIADTPEARRDMAGFIVRARRIDELMGGVLGALGAAGLAGETLVICTTDHGIAFPAMKCNLTDHGTAVMLIVRGPGGFDGGKVSDALVSQVDLFPTVCDLLGIRRPAWLTGHSLLPLVRARADEVRQAVFTEVTYHAAYEPQRAVRTRRWKYIRRYGDRERPVLPNCDDSPTKDLWMRHGWPARLTEREQLYDLLFDPHEAHNLAAAPACSAALAEMSQRLDRWMAETADPLLAGPVPAARGAVANDPDGVSPSERTYEP